MHHIHNIGLALDFVYESKVSEVAGTNASELPIID
jgi:hypothetical protein